MKIKALRPLNGHYGQKDPGEVFEVGEALGKSLVERGVAQKVKGAAPHSNKMAGQVDNKAASGPLDGSPTGGDAAASSSPAAPARPRSTSRSRGARTRSSS